MKRLSFCALFLLVSSFSINQSFACTTFCLKNKGEVLFGKNYDWSIGDGIVLVNKRGVAKTATVEAAPNPAKWVSKYGSVTFNQYGRENPSGGMNEAGLVIELMWLDDAEYPKADSRPTVGTLEWIQYQLDNSATVDEVIKNAEALRIASLVKLHYLVNDKNGKSATIEFLNGKLAAHAGDQLPVPALTNDTYEKSVNYTSQAAAGKGNRGSSLERFTRASEKTREFGKQEKGEQEAVNYAFETLSNVAQEGYTQWSIVYDQKRGRIYFRTMQAPQIKMIDAKTFDYSCGTPVKMFDVNSKTSGEVTAQFANYTLRANRDLIERSFSGTDFLKDIPAPMKNLVASYPESFACTSQNSAVSPDTNKPKGGRVTPVKP